MLDSAMGTGHTVVRQVSAKGVEQTSTGDTLNVVFRRGVVHGGKAAGINGDQASSTVRSAVQEGHVTVERRLPAKTNGQGKGEDIERAAAAKAVYDGNADQLTLSGAVRVSNADGTLWANQVALDRASGDARASGRVKADYAQAAQPGSAGRNRGPEEPMHVLADRAALQHRATPQETSPARHPRRARDRASRHRQPRRPSACSAGSARRTRRYHRGSRRERGRPRTGASSRTSNYVVRFFFRTLSMAARKSSTSRATLSRAAATCLSTASSPACQRCAQNHAWSAGTATWGRNSISGAGDGSNRA